MEEVLVRHTMNEDTGIYSIEVNVQSEENGKTEKERWLYAAKKFRETAEVIEEKWSIE